jgi:proteic killer suppression protein
MAIQGFRSTVIERFFCTGKVPLRAGWRKIARKVTQKLDVLHYAERLDDLRSPPGNRLEALKWDLVGFHSIRINDQWRILFRWTDQGPEAVDIVDYH